MKAKLIVLFLSVCLASTAGQLDTSVCTGQIPDPNDPPLPPSLPNVFDVHVEANINNRNYTSDYHIWYDQAHNQVATHVDTGGTKSENLYRFDTNEFYHVDRDQGTCTVQPLSKSPQLFLFGTTSGGMVTMKTPNQFLLFNEIGISHKWINQTVVRGITCNLWRSCQYWGSMKATMVVDWYFSDLEWTTSRLSLQIPVRAHVYGKAVMPNGQKRSFDHMYEFSDFNPNPDKNVNAYQTPAGVYCQRAKNTKPLPTPPSVFHFTSEIITVSSKTISSIKMDPSLSCEICEKYFTKPKNLRRHKNLQHTDKPPIACLLCDKTFSLKSNMRRHVRVVHQDIKKHACTQCEKTFGTKAQLLGHRRNHHGSLKLKCSNCGKAFAYTNHLNAHKKDCTGNQNQARHPCSICRKTYKTAKSLAWHTKHVHEETESRVCESCGDVFTCKYSLKRHIKRRHQD